MASSQTPKGNLDTSFAVLVLGGTRRGMEDRVKLFGSEEMILQQQFSRKENFVEECNRDAA
jgi:hypothetical protein